MPKGKHKGGRRTFTNFEEVGSKQEKEEKEKAWRKARGEEVNDSDEGSSDDETESSEESGEEEDQPKPKAKGTEGLIEIENPNYVAVKTKKVSALGVEEPSESATQPQLSRKEKEEVDRQKKAANYRKLHAQGKTDEARADLERLALIKKQREEAQKKKEDEKKAKDEATALKRDQVAKALNKKDKGSAR